MARSRVFVTPEWIASIETKPWRSKTGEERLYINDWQQLIGMRMELDEHGKWQRAYFGTEPIERSEYRKAAAAKAYVVGNLLTVEGSTSTHITDGIIAAQMQAAVARATPGTVHMSTTAAGLTADRSDGWQERSWALADGLFERTADVDAGAVLARLRARMDSVEAQFTGDAIAYHTSEAIWKTITAPVTDMLPWDRDTDPGGPEMWDLRASEDLVHAQALIDCTDLITPGIRASADSAALTAVTTAIEYLTHPSDGRMPIPATRRSILRWLDENSRLLDDPGTQRWWPEAAREWMVRSGGLPPDLVSPSAASYVDELEWLAVAAREVPRAQATRTVLGLLTGDDAMNAPLPVPVEWTAAMAGELPPFRPEPLPTHRVAQPDRYAAEPLLLADLRGFDDLPAPTLRTPVGAAIPERPLVNAEVAL